jgi:hypothetical protein
MPAKIAKFMIPFFNNNIVTFEEFLMTEMDINPSDKGSRTALLLAASYNSPLKIFCQSHMSLRTNQR